MNTQETKQEIMEEWQRLKFEHMQHFGRMADSEMIFKTCVLPLLDKALLSQLEEIEKVLKGKTKKIDYSYQNVPEEWQADPDNVENYGYNTALNEILSHLEKLNIKK